MAPDRDIFKPNGLLLKAHYDFLKDEVAQNVVSILGYFFY